MHLRRARPTLRLLTEDLTSDWESPNPRRHLEEMGPTSLHPLSELRHPIIIKALSCFGDDPASDSFVGTIAASSNLPLLEVKVGRWRGGVWYDEPQDVCWLVIAGIARGDHEDFHDFYRRVEREKSSYSRWLPTDTDIRLLKRERAAQRLSDWELDVQRLVFEGLQHVHQGGSTRFELPHPVAAQGPIATVTLVMTPDHEGDCPVDAVDLDIVPDSRHAGGGLFWSAVLRVLITLSPPEQGWDRYRNSYSNIDEPGHWTQRVTELEALVADAVLAESISGEHAHYTHREHIAGSVVAGTALRALCGAYFVSTQIPDTLPECPKCAQRLSELPPAQ